MLTGISLKSNIEKVKKALSLELAKKTKDGSTAYKKVILSTFNIIVMRSPVDTGAYRNSHTLIAGDVNTAGDFSINKNFQHNQMEAVTTLQNSNAKRYTILNALPYAWSIENGHSKQAPQGVYAVARLRAIENWKKLTKGGGI